MTAPLDNHRQVGLNESPDQLVVDLGVFVSELVAEGDDLWCLFDLLEQLSILLRKLMQCLADDGELPLQR